METKLALLMVSLLTGCCCLNKPDNTIVDVPVVIHQKVERPVKPALATAKLNNNSTEDEVLKAALKDLEGLKAYSKELENLVDVK